MALTKVTGQVIKNTTDVTVGVLTVTNTLAVGGTVSIGGTLTYEDVTNVDAVGLITARDGIKVGSGITLSVDGDIFSTGVTTSTTFVGALTGTASGNATVSSNASTRIITGGSGNALTGNSDLLWNGSRLDIDTGGTEDALRIGNSAGTDTFIRLGSTGTTVDTHAVLKYDKDDNYVSLLVSGESHGNGGILIANGGAVSLSAGTSPSAKLHVKDDVYVKGSSGDGSVGIQIRSGSSALSNQHQIRTGGGSGDQLFIEALGGSSAIVTKVAGSERARIDSSGRLLIGTSSNTFTNVGSSRLQVSGTGADTAGINLIRTDDSTGGAYLQFTKNRGSATQSGDTCGAIAWMGHDGTDVESYIAQIMVKAGATATSNSMTGYIMFSTSNGSSVTSERLRITANGDVRVGGGAPVTFGSGTTVHETYNANTYTANLVTSGTHQLQMIASQTHGATSIGTRSNHNLSLTTNDTTRLTIDTSGRMGLGTVLQSDAGSAGAGLKIETYLQRNTVYAFPDGYYGASLGEVQNTENKVWASVDSHYNRTSAVSAGLFLSAFHADTGGSGCGSAIKNLKSGNALTFSNVTTASSTGNPAVETEVFRIDSSGRLLLGTTTSNAPAGSLHIKNAYLRLQAANQTSSDFSQEVGIEWSQEEGSDVQVGKIVMRRTGWAGAPHSMDFYSRTSGNQVTRNMTIDHDGGIYFQNLLGNAASGSTVKYSNSDKELRYDTSSKLLKTNITELTKYGIDTVKKLKPSTFTPQEYNKDGTITVGDGTLIGFIADEMVTEVPEVVQMYPKSTLTKQEGDTEIVPAAISYDKLTVVLTKALQEAIAKIETLETEVAALKSQLNN